LQRFFCKHFPASVFFIYFPSIICFDVKRLCYLSALLFFGFVVFFIVVILLSLAIF
jgi:hypothetical protein